MPVFYWEKAKKIDLPEANKKDRGELVHVYPSGRVWWSSQAEFTISCSMADNMDALPFDRQKCNFLMGMYSDSDARVAVRWKGYDPNDPSAPSLARRLHARSLLLAPLTRADRVPNRQPSASGRQWHEPRQLHPLRARKLQQRHGTRRRRVEGR